MKKSRTAVFKNGKFDKTFLDIVYFVLFSLVTCHKFLQTTMFEFECPVSIRMLLRILLVVYFVIKVWNGCRLDKYANIFLVVFAGSAFLIWKNTGQMEVVDITLLIAGAYGIKFDKILKVYMAVAVPGVILTVAASQFGLIENLIYHRGEITRAAFGFAYPTDFVAHVFCIMIIWCVLRNVSLKYWEFIVFIVLAVLAYIFCNARMNVLCMMLTVVVFLVMKWWNEKAHKCVNKEKIEQKISGVLIWGTPICAIVMILMTWFYDRSNSVWEKLNNLVSYRFEFGKQGFDEYGISLFGQDLPIVGMGKTTVWADNYFFLDSSYVRVLLEYGIVIFLIVLVMFTVSGYRLHKEKRYYLLLALNLMAVQCVIEHHILEIAYNPFLYMIFADITSVRSKGVLDDKESKQVS